MDTKTINPLDSQAQALCLAVFRICYGCVLFLEVCQIFYFRHLLFDAVPYLQPAPALLNALLIVWLISILCVISGYRTTLACLFNYVLSVIFLGRLLYPLFEYHVDYVYIGVNFLLILTPVGDRLSLDVLRQKIISTANPRNYAIFIDGIIFLGIALVYADSIFFKFSSPMWRDGLGVWLPASLPQNTWITVPQFFLDQKWLMLFLGYLTLVFETTFPVLMWWRPIRPVLFGIGAGLHFSIGLVFPIPFFGLTYLALYLLLLPASFWRHLDSKLQNSVVDIPSDDVLSTQTVSVNQSAWGWREKMTLTTLCLASVLQVCFILARYQTFPEQVRPVSLKPAISLIFRSGTALRNLLKTPSHTLLGVNDHGVFVDSHFQGYNHLFAIRYHPPQGKQELLPLAYLDGTPGSYASGRIWALWCFRLNGADVPLSMVVSGMQKLTAFWAFNNNLPLGDIQFDILSRPVQTPNQWEKGYLQEQLKSEWKIIGQGSWKQGRFQLIPVKKP